MKIKDVIAISLEVPMDEPLRIANVKFDYATTTIVKIITDDGIVGIGECIARLSPKTTKDIVQQILKPILIGRDPLDVEAIWNDMYNSMRGRGHSRGFLIEAIAGVDIAIWDIIGKYHKLPIAKILGGYDRKKVEVYASSLMHKNIEILEKEAEDLLDKGYKGIKLKVGRGVEKDIENIKRIRNVIGSDIHLMVDANSYYKANEAITLGNKMEKYDVYWFEEPVPSDDLNGYEKINRTLKVPIAGGESEFTAYGFRDLMERDALEIVQPDIARAGGFTECKKIANLTSIYNKYYAPHTGMSSAICIIASLHLAAALPNFLTFEYMILDNPLFRIFKEPIPEVKDGFCDVPQKPGLGIELDKDALQSMTNADLGKILE